MFWHVCHTKFGTIVGAGVDRGELPGLMADGGWVTAGAMFGSLLVIADRFLIGIVLNVRTVALYTVPMPSTQRLGAVPPGLENALFPRLATAQGAEAPRLSARCDGAIATGRRGYHVVQADNGPAGRERHRCRRRTGRPHLADRGMVQRLCSDPVVQLQAQGRPDVVAWLLLAQIRFYLPTFWFALHAFGLIGAAVVYLVRLAVDYAALFLITGRQIDHGSAVALLSMGLVGLAVLPTLPLAVTLPAAILMAATILFTCRHMLPPTIA